MMIDWKLYEIEFALRSEAERNARAHPTAAPAKGNARGVRRRIARLLVELGVWLDSGASRAAAGLERAPRLKGTHV